MIDSSRQVLYFGYGSNLNTHVMLGRVPHAEFLRTAYFPGHHIAFAGHDGEYGHGGTMTVVPAMSLVPGVLWRMTREDLFHLDRSEGNPSANHRHNEYAYGWDGTRYEVFMYRQNWGTPLNPPSREYLVDVLKGRMEHGLPTDDVVREAKRAFAVHSAKSVAARRTLPPLV